jgi:hypothetical protein
VKVFLLGDKAKVRSAPPSDVTTHAAGD